MQQKLKQPSDKKTRHYSTGIFSGKVKCGSFYGTKVWYSNDKYRTTIWQCNQKFGGEEKCSTPHLREEELKAIYLKAVNKLFENKDAVIDRMGKMLLRGSDTFGIEK